MEERDTGSQDSGIAGEDLGKRDAGSAKILQPLPQPTSIFGRREYHEGTPSVRPRTPSSEYHDAHDAQDTGEDRPSPTKKVKRSMAPAAESSSATSASPSQTSHMHCIADAGLLQRLLDGSARSPCVPWLVQFYLAGLVTRKRFDWEMLSRPVLLEALRQPTAMDAAARMLQPECRQMLWKRPSQDASPLPHSVLAAFEQYDQECSAEQQEFNSKGRVCLRGVISTEPAGRLVIKLAPPKLSPSTRVSQECCLAYADRCAEFGAVPALGDAAIR